MRKFIKGILLLMFAIVMSGTYEKVYAQELEKRSQQDIREMTKELTYTFDDVTFVTEPSIKNPYLVGEVSQKSLKEALNAVNMVRYIAGLPADIVLDETYNDYAQHGAVVDAVNDELTHYPDKPADMEDAFYDAGSFGTSHSNIGWGYPSFNITNSILCYMSDSDAYNIDRVGHRRWLLNPDMARIGFGFANNYTVTYVMDDSRTEDINYDYIAWPAGQMPMEYFSENDAWSVNLGDAYEIPSIDTVEVTLTRVSDQKEWVFNKAALSEELTKQSDRTGGSITNLSYGTYFEIVEDYFNVDNGGYGIPKCIIFRPAELDYTDNEKYNVQITGLMDMSGNPTSLEYTVTFFAIKELQKIDLGVDTEDLYIGNLSEPRVFYFPEDTGSDKDIIWSSSNPKVAKVDEYGVIMALKKGIAVITATSIVNKKIFSHCTVTVDNSSPPSTVKNLKIEVNSSSLKLSWDEVFNADYYEIQYATDSNFKNAKKVTAKSLSKTLKNLKKGQTYYIRVRAHKTFSGYKLFGKWSEVRKVKI